MDWIGVEGWRNNWRWHVWWNRFAVTALDRNSVLSDLTLFVSDVNLTCQMIFITEKTLLQLDITSNWIRFQFEDNVDRCISRKVIYRLSLVHSGKASREATSPSDSLNSSDCENAFRFAVEEQSLSRPQPFKLSSTAVKNRLHFSLH